MNANGRVNILDPINSSVFQLYDKIPIDEKTTSYRDALTGNIESNKLSKTFFSSGNIILKYVMYMKDSYSFIFLFFVMNT